MAAPRVRLAHLQCRPRSQYKTISFQGQFSILSTFSMECSHKSCPPSVWQLPHCDSNCARSVCIVPPQKPSTAASVAALASCSGDCRSIRRSGSASAHAPADRSTAGTAGLPARSGSSGPALSASRRTRRGSSPSTLGTLQSSFDQREIYQSPACIYCNQRSIYQSHFFSMSAATAGADSASPASAPGANLCPILNAKSII